MLKHTLAVAALVAPLCVHRRLHRENRLTAG